MSPLLLLPSPPVRLGRGAGALFFPSESEGVALLSPLVIYGFDTGEVDEVRLADRENGGRFRSLIH
jgi:hypothetical protein